MPRVLFVCEGNKMRSPMAEAFYNQLTGTRDAISAGSSPYPLGGSFETTIEAMREVGIALDHDSQLVTQQMVDAADIVIAFPTATMLDFVANNPKTIASDVADPYYQSGSQLDQVRKACDEIRERVEVLIAKHK